MLASLVLSTLLLAADTTVVLSERSQDLTGDGLLERMRLVGQGDLTDSLFVTLTIESSEDTLYSDTFIVDRELGFDAGRYVATDEQWADLLGYYESVFFDDSKFARIQEVPSVVLVRPRDLSERAWESLLDSNAAVFQYSPGGDRVYSLAWIPERRRFLDVAPCC